MGRFVATEHTALTHRLEEHGEQKGQQCENDAQQTDPGNGEPVVTVQGIEEGVGDAVDLGVESG